MTFAVLGPESAKPHDEQERAFLQQRLAQFAKWAFFLSVASTAVSIATGTPADPFSLAWFLDHAVMVLMAAMWLVCSRGEHSIRWLRAIDAGVAGLTTVFVALLGRFLAVQLLPEMVASQGSSLPASAAEAGLVDIYTSTLMMLGGAIIFAFRAAVIPSPPVFTLFVTGVLGLPYVLVPAFVAPATGGQLALRATPSLTGDVVSFGIWWAVVTAACVATSVVIYGLRREVRDAQRLGQYTLVEKIGEGGMGVVYRASHSRLRRPTAIKLLPQDHFTEDAVARFESEVQLTAELTHPNTITVYDYGRTDDGVFYYAMEYLDGATLAEIVDVDGAQPPARVVRILKQAASALQEAHEVGLIHRDVKPANIMLTRRGVDHDAVKLLDFGLARPSHRDDDATITRRDRLVGSPLYMAPEVIRDPNAMTERSDLYSLGAVGYLLISGVDVFPSESVVEVCAHHLHTEPERPSRRLDREIPEDLESLLLQCLSKKPSERPASAEELVRRLDALQLSAVWTDELAQAWWKRHQPALLRARQAPEPIDNLQLTVASRV